jgi:hypothetical protein
VKKVLAWKEKPQPGASMEPPKSKDQSLWWST